MKRFFLGILVAFFIVGCTTEEAEVTAEQDISFLEPSEQTRLWKEYLETKQKELPELQAKNNYAFCEHYGNYSAVFVTYEGGHTDCCGYYNGLARYQNVLALRYEYYLANLPTPSNPCPKYRIPAAPNLEYIPSADVYTEVWEAYGSKGGDGIPGPKSLVLNADEDEDNDDN